MDAAELKDRIASALLPRGEILEACLFGPRAREDARLGCLEVDRGTVHRLLNDRLDDFAEFARHVDLYLRDAPGS